MEERDLVLTLLLERIWEASLTGGDIEVGVCFADLLAWSFGDLAVFSCY
jgi:hypothetical protein